MTTPDDMPQPDDATNLQGSAIHGSSSADATGNRDATGSAEEADCVAADVPRAFPSLRDAWYLTGPTAAGKTSVAIALAKAINAEIISLDSMALYRGMDVGTAKPDARQRAEVPHHLLDLRNPNEEFSLAEYMQAAHATAAEIRSRQRTVLFVGGTALYLKSLLRGVTTGPEADWEFRLQLQREIEEHGLPALHARLQLVDPLAAAKLHPNDKRRIIRALEVARKIGQPISHLQTQFDEEIRSQPCRVVTLAWPRPELHGRIERRVEQMFANDLVGEVRRLLADFGTLGRTASQAVGYREVLEHLRGEKSLPETVLAVQARSRQFARRQETWFRSLSECIALPMHPDEEPGKTVERILTEPTLALDRERVS